MALSKPIEDDLLRQYQDVVDTDPDGAQCILAQVIGQKLELGSFLKKNQEAYEQIRQTKGHWVDRYRCPECKHSLATLEDLGRCLSRHPSLVLPAHDVLREAETQKELRWVCPLCRKDFVSKQFLKEHFLYDNEAHGGVPVICEICAQRFRAPPALRSHFRTQHRERTEENSLHCPKCQKEYSTSEKFNMEKHMETCTGIARKPRETRRNGADAELSTTDSNQETATSSRITPEATRDVAQHGTESAPILIVDDDEDSAEVTDQHHRPPGLSPSPSLASSPPHVNPTMRWNICMEIERDIPIHLRADQSHPHRLPKLNNNFLA